MYAHINLDDLSRGDDIDLFLVKGFVLQVSIEEFWHLYTGSAQGVEHEDVCTGCHISMWRRVNDMKDHLSLRLTPSFACFPPVTW